MHYPGPHCDENNTSKVEKLLSIPQKRGKIIHEMRNSLSALSVFGIRIIRVLIATENILSRVENQISSRRRVKKVSIDKNSLSEKKRYTGPPCYSMLHKKHIFSSVKLYIIH